MLIHELGEEGREAAVELWRQVGPTRPWNDPDADFRRAIAGPNSAVLAGTDDGRVMATVMVGHDGHRGWVYYLAVDRDARGRRHAHAMMTAAEQWLRDRHIPKLNLMIRSENLDVQAFYQAIRYTQEHVVVYSHRLTDDTAPPTVGG